MSAYLGASVLVALFTKDGLTPRAESYFRNNVVTVVVADLAAAEFASALARKVRTRDLSPQEARAVLAKFDAWIARAAARPEISPSDVAAAAGFLRRLDLTLRTADAINIAMAQRLGASLATFDTSMAQSARILGTDLVSI